MFDHRSSIVKYLETEAEKRESRNDDDARRQAITYRVIASNINAGLDLPAANEADAA